jgi:hypothetical protein
LIAVFVGLAGALLFACESSSAPPPPPAPTNSMEATCGAARTASTPPARVSTAAPAGTTRWFVLDRLNLGTINLRTSLPSNDAWRCYGFNLDARTTTSAQSKLGDTSCKRRPGAPGSALADGAGGIDNHFGRDVLPVLRSLDRCLDDRAFGADGLTFFLRVDGAVDGDTASAPGALYVARAAATDGGAKKLARSDVPVADFHDGYVTGGTWVSGSPSAQTIDLPLQVGFEFELAETKPEGCPRKAELRLPLSEVVLSVQVFDGGGGIVAGAIASDALGDAVRSWLADFAICGRSADAIAEALMTNASDLVAGAPKLRDPTKTCDAVSFGAAFPLARTTDPGEYGAFPPRANSCANSPPSE